jgi:hypothetical protein
LERVKFQEWAGNTLYGWIEVALFVFLLLAKVEGHIVIPAEAGIQTPSMR